MPDPSQMIAALLGQQPQNTISDPNLMANALRRPPVIPVGTYQGQLNWDSPESREWSGTWDEIAPTHGMSPEDFMRARPDSEEGVTFDERAPVIGVPSHEKGN